MSVHNGFTRAAAITPSDTDDLPQGLPCDALLVCAAGNIVFRAAQSSGNVTITAAAAGQVIPVKVRRVLSTGTTATVAALSGA